MIGIYDNNGARLAITYNGFTFNSPNDDETDTVEVNEVVGSTALDYVSETNQQRDGLEVYPFRKVSRIVTLKCTLRAPTMAALHDKIQDLAAACDPAKISHENPDDFFLPLDFKVPTADTANYPSGFADSRYYALPLRTPEPAISYATGYVALVDVTFVMADPRRYLQAAVTQSGAGVIANSKADYRSWPTLTITMSGAGSATYTVTNTHSLDAPSLVLDLSGLVASDVVVVDMRRRKITVDGVEDASLYVSGDYFEIEPGNNTIAYANTGGVSSSVLSFRPAFCI